MSTQVNKLGADWLLIKKWLRDRIEASHHNIENGLTLEEYHAQRGRILMAKELIEMVEPTAPPQTSEDDYGISTGEKDIYG